MVCYPLFAGVFVELLFVASSRVRELKRGYMLLGLEQSCPLSVAVVKQLQSLGVGWDSGSQLVIALASCFYGKPLKTVPREHLDIIALYQEFLANPVRFANLSSYLPRQPLQLSLF